MTQRCVCECVCVCVCVCVCLWACVCVHTHIGDILRETSGFFLKKDQQVRRADSLDGRLAGDRIEERYLPKKVSDAVLVHQHLCVPVSRVI